MLINRRTFIETAAAIPLLSTVTPASAATALDLTSIRTAQQFGAEVIGRADLSRAASEIALKKVAREDAKEFAGLELMEANTVIEVLKELGTVVPVMGAEAQAALASIRDAAEGAAFDKAYISAEYTNHVFLRDLAAAYLKNSDAATASVDERHGRQLASLALFAFTEHVAITHRIAQALSAA
jgi:hypothetical protein